MQYEKKEILILVKTYPNISKKYQEVVCTAGIDDIGKWYRLYPIPFRQLGGEEQKYKKYDTISVDVFKDTSDPRIESYKVKSETIKVIKHIDTKNNWRDRNIYVNKTYLYDDKDIIINKNKQGDLSICRFKPTKVLDVIIEAVDREYTPEQKESIKNYLQQPDMFEEKDIKTLEKIIPKLPYKFSYKFLDKNHKESILMIEDWEIGQLFWNLEKQYKNENTACEKVKEKYMKFAENNDLKFFLGTTRQYDSWASNPFVIIGIYYPTLEKQQQLTFID